MVVLTQKDKGENENLTQIIFRATEGNERSFTLIKPQGSDRVTPDCYPEISWPGQLLNQRQDYRP